MRALQFTGPLYVMGRSMGRHAAGELAITAGDRINGVIIESGRPNLGRVAQGLEPGGNTGAGRRLPGRFYSIDIPALVIHGQWDDRRRWPTRWTCSTSLRPPTSTWKSYRARATTT